MTFGIASMVLVQTCVCLSTNEVALKILGKIGLSQTKSKPQHITNYMDRCYYNVPLYAGDHIWCARFWATFIPVMVCFVMAPSHYPKKWLAIHGILRHLHNGKFHGDLSTTLIGLKVNTCDYFRRVTTRLWPLLLTWFNFNPSMDK